MIARPKHHTQTGLNITKSKIAALSTHLLFFLLPIFQPTKPGSKEHSAHNINRIAQATWIERFPMESTKQTAAITQTMRHSHIPMIVSKKLRKLFILSVPNLIHPTISYSSSAITKSFCHHPLHCNKKIILPCVLDRKKSTPPTASTPLI